MWASTREGRRVRPWSMHMCMSSRGSLGTCLIREAAFAGSCRSVPLIGVDECGNISHRQRELCFCPSRQCGETSREKADSPPDGTLTRLRTSNVGNLPYHVTRTAGYNRSNSWMKLAMSTSVELHGVQVNRLEVGSASSTRRRASRLPAGVRPWAWSCPLSPSGGGHWLDRMSCCSVRRHAVACQPYQA